MCILIFMLLMVAQMACFVNWLCQDDVLAPWLREHSIFWACITVIQIVCLIMINLNK